MVTSSAILALWKFLKSGASLINSSDAIYFGMCRPFLLIQVYPLITLHTRMQLLILAGLVIELLTGAVVSFDPGAFLLHLSTPLVETFNDLLGSSVSSFRAGKPE